MVFDELYFTAVFVVFGVIAYEIYTDPINSIPHILIGGTIGAFIGFALDRLE